jgi:hypothetical protein
MRSEPEMRELALKYLEISRLDFRQRVELKQKVIITYAGAIAAILGFVLNSYSRNPEFINILWVVPVLALLAAGLFADHMLATVGLTQYQQGQLQPYLRVDDCKLPLWDTDKSMNDLIGIFWTLQLGQEILICLPSILSLGVLCFRFVTRWSVLALHTRSLDVFLLVCGLFCLVVSYILLNKIRGATKAFGPGVI